MAGKFPERDLTASASLKVRLDEWLRRRLDEAAKRSRRSLNAEVIARLEASLVFADVVLKPPRPGAKPEPTFDLSTLSKGEGDQDFDSLKQRALQAVATALNISREDILNITIDTAEPVDDDAYEKADETEKALRAIRQEAREKAKQADDNTEKTLKAIQEAMKEKEARDKTGALYKSLEKELSRKKK